MFLGLNGLEMTMEITPLTPIFAAEIEGVELARIDDEEFAAVIMSVGGELD